MYICKQPKGNYEKVTIIHETGHMLGLSHPGQASPRKALPNSREDYEADPESLMGLGNILRPRDFQKAFCNRVQSMMRQRLQNKKKNSSKYCTKWIAK